MAASMSRTSPGEGNHKVLLATLLCIAAAAAAGGSFVPVSSASTPLVAQTCGRTSNRLLCVSLLESGNRSRSATTVRELAVIALTGARRSALRARLRAFGLSYGARGGTATPAGRRVARCAALYRDCLHAATHALSRVTRMPAYDGRVADAVSGLRVFTAKCQRLFDARGVVSPPEQLNRDTEAKLGIASEIVRLLRLESPAVSLAHGDVESNAQIEDMAQVLSGADR